MRDYNPKDISSIFQFSGKLLRHTLAQVVPLIDPSISKNDLIWKGKGGINSM